MKTLLSLVVSLHLLFLVLLLFKAPFLSEQHAYKPLKINTIVAAPPRPHSAAPMHEKTPAAAAPLKQKPAEKQKPTREQKTPSVKKPAPAATPARKGFSSSLIHELQESIAKIENTQKTGVVKSKPSSTFTLHIDQKDEEEHFADVLVDILHHALHLPDFGEVKIALTLRKEGSIAKLLVLKAESEENRKYLERHLPTLRFPPLQGASAKETEHTFILTFCNAL